MRNTQKIIMAAAAILALAVPAMAKDWKTIKIGTEGAYPPFNSIDSNKELVGFDIDIGKALCKQMQAECSFVAQDWDGIIPALDAGKFDAILASMSITEERKKKVDFTDKYYNTPASFIAPKKTPLPDPSPAAMKGKTIGAQSSTTHATYLEDVYKPAGATIKLYPTQDEANLDLASGRLDAVLADKVVLLEWLGKSKDGECCGFVGKDIKEVKWFGEGAGIAVRKADGDLKSQINAAIAAIIANGEYKKINDKYFPFSIY